MLPLVGSLTTKKPVPLMAMSDLTPVLEIAPWKNHWDAGGGHARADLRGAGGIGAQRFAQGVGKIHVGAFEPHRVDVGNVVGDDIDLLLVLFQGADAGIEGEKHNFPWLLRLLVGLRAWKSRAACGARA